MVGGGGRRWRQQRYLMFNPSIHLILMLRCIIKLHCCKAHSLLLYDVPLCNAHSVLNRQTNKRTHACIRAKGGKMGEILMQHRIVNVVKPLTKTKYTCISDENCAT